VTHRRKQRLQCDRSGCTRDGKPVAPDEEKLSRSRVNTDRTEIRTKFGDRVVP